MPELTTLKIGSCAFTFNPTNYTTFNEECFDSCSESEDEDVSWLIMRSVCFCFHQRIDLPNLKILSVLSGLKSTTFAFPTHIVLEGHSFDCA